MDLENLSMKMVRYRMNYFKLNIKGTIYDVESDDISFITIEKDYSGNFYFPYFEVEVLIPTYILRAMKKNSNNITANINFQRGYFRDNEIDMHDLPVFSTYVSGLFYVFMEDNTPDVTEAASVRVEEGTETGKNGKALGEDQTVKLLLYNKSYFFGLRNIVNNVLASVTAVEAITYVINQAGVSNILITPPDSYKKYSQFVLVPICASDQLVRICNKYKVYKDGALVFFDLDKGYIISRSKECTAYYPNEIKTTYIINTSGGDDDKKGCCIYNKKNYINVRSDSIMIDDNSEVSNQSFGSMVTVVDEEGNIKNIDTKSKKSAYTITSPTRVLVKDKGEDNSTHAVRRAANTDEIITIKMDYVDLDMLTPNLKFISHFSDSLLSGFNKTLSLNKMICLFSKEGEFFVPNITAEFQ